MNAPIFNWYKVLKFWKNAFDGKTIWRFHFNSSDPDLDLLSSRIGGSLLDEGKIQKSINETINNINSVKNETSSEENENSDTSDGSSFYLLSNESKSLKRFSLPRISQATLLEDDFADSISLDLTKFDVTEEESKTFIRNLYTLSLVIVPIILFFVIGLIYYLLYCFCCCCCCRPKRHQRPHIILVIFFLLSLTLIALGYVFTAISFSPLEHIKDTIVSFPADFDESVDILSQSLTDVADELSKTLDKSISDAINATRELSKYANTTVLDIQQKVVALKDDLILDDEKIRNKDPEDVKNIPAPEGIVPYYKWTILKTALLAEDENIEFQEKYDKDFTDFVKEKDLFAEINDKVHEVVVETSKQLDSVADLSDELSSMDDTMDSVNEFTDVFDQFEDIIDQFNDYKNISNLSIGDNETIGEAIQNLKTSDSVKSFKDIFVSAKEDFIDKYFLYVKIGYLFLWSLNVFLIIGFLGSFFCYNCCARCVAACAECYPCVCSFFLFFFGLLCTLFCTILVFLGKGLFPFIDDTIDAAIAKGVPGSILTFPPIDVSEKLGKNVRTCQLPAMNLSNLEIFQTALSSKLGTGLSDFISLNKIFDFPGIKEAINTFLDNILDDYGIKDTIEGNIKNITKDLNENDVLPQCYNRASEGYPVSATCTETEKKSFREKYLFNCNDDGDDCTYVYDRFKTLTGDIDKIYVDALKKYKDELCDKLPSEQYENSTWAGENQCCVKLHQLTSSDDITSSHCNANTKASTTGSKNFKDYTAEEIDKKSKLDLNADGTPKAGSDTYENNIKKKHGNMLSKKQSVLDKLNGFADEAMEKIKPIIGAFQGLITDLAGSFSDTLNKIKADPLINGMAIIYNILFYEISYLTTTISLGCTLILLGFIVSVILMCCRRRSMKPDEDEQESYSSEEYSSDNNTIDFSKKSRAVSRRQRSDYSSSYSSSSDVRRRRRDVESV
jgi:hypothetical protein